MDNKPIIETLFVFLLFVSLFVLPTKALSFQQNDETDFYKGKLVTQVEFKGNTHFTSKELLDAFNIPDNLAQKANLIMDYPYSKSRTQHYLQTKLRRYLFNHGYFKAYIDEPIIIPNGDSIKLVVPIQEGQLFHWGNLKIEGAKVFSQSKIEKIIGYTKGKAASSRLFFDGVNLKLKTKYKEKGLLYFDAEIESTFNSDNSVDLIISIDEGLPFKVKTIDFSKSDSSQKEFLKQVIPLKEGDVFKQSNLIKSIDKLNKIKKFYDIEEQNDVEVILGEKPESDGYFRATVTFKVTPIKAVEKKYYFASIKFIGNKTISNDELKKAFGFEVGKEFNTKDFVKRIKNFNKSGKTKPVLEDDVGAEIGEEGRQDDETSDKLNITLIIREKN